MVEGMGDVAQQTRQDRRAALYLGTILCILLAFFTVERRVAAYPTHNVAAATIARTTVQKSTHIAFEEKRSLQAPLIFLCLLAPLAALATQNIRPAYESEMVGHFRAWTFTPFFVRPPPAF